MTATRTRADRNLIPLAAAVDVAFPMESVWPLLADPATVASCIPGALLRESTGPGKFAGAFEFRFGPTVATFTGEVALEYDHASHRCAIDGRGADRKGTSRAVARFDLTATGEATTHLDLAGGFNVSGPLSTFASAGGVHLAQALVAEFGANLQKLLEARHRSVEAPAHDGAGSVERARAAGVSDVVRLLWRAIVEGLRKVLRRDAR